MESPARPLMKVVKRMKRAFWIAVIVGLISAPRHPARALGQSSQPQTVSTGQTTLASEEIVPVAQQATKEQLKKLFEVMRLRQQFEETMKMLPSVVQQQLRLQMGQLTASMPDRKQMTPEQRKELDTVMNRYMEMAATPYPVDEMIVDAISVYQRHMTREDADAYITFFSSPPGQHFLDAQPAIMKEYMPIAMERAQRRTQELTLELSTVLAEFAKSVKPAKQVPEK
jgi:hypothetical protein